MNRLRIGALAFGAMTVLTVAGLPGRALAQPAGGTEHFTIALTKPNSGSVLAFGAFNAKGTDDEHPTSNTSGKSTFHFPKGNIVVNHTDNPGGSSTFNPKACVAHFTGSGDYTIKDGTGAYKGIEGHGQFTVSGTVVLAHTAHGCGHQIGQLTIVKAHGPVSFDNV